MEFVLREKDAEQLNGALRLAVVCMGDLLCIQVYKQAGKSHEYSSRYHLSKVLVFFFLLTLKLINAHISWI